MPSNELEHYGVKGMKWGKHVGRSRKTDVPIPMHHLDYYVLDSKNGDQKYSGAANKYGSMVTLPDGKVVPSTDERVPSDFRKQLNGITARSRMAYDKVSDFGKKKIQQNRSSYSKVKMSSIKSNKLKSVKTKIDSILKKSLKVKTPY